MLRGALLSIIYPGSLNRRTISVKIGVSKNKILAGAMKSLPVSLKNKKATKMEEIVDRDFCNIWWLLKEPFVFESKLI